MCQDEDSVTIIVQDEMWRQRLELCCLEQGFRTWTVRDA
jgi:hypothetical protein